MKYVAWRDVKNNLWSIRQRAELFLDGFADGSFGGAMERHNCFAQWTCIGDAHRALADLNSKRGEVDEATEAWLCALTAFEVARRLVDEDDPQIEDISSRVKSVILAINLSLKQKLERVQISCCDQAEVHGYYVSAGTPDVCAPAVICIGSKQETDTILLGRLLPAVVGKDMSVLVVSHAAFSDRSRLESEILLSCCLDFLSSRPNVDPGRIGVFGEGLSAALATTFAASDRRVAAAVCDGGLWNWAQALASVGWRSAAADLPGEELNSERRLRLVRQLRCPVLVVAGGRGIVSVSEATKLQAESRAVGIDLELAIHPMAHTTIGEMENFVTSDNRIIGWLEHKLAYPQIALLEQARRSSNRKT
ncbi:hypothetical protein QRQ56_35405 [Bradyrhizobium sp. U531]|uniref:alpha/beta hydrolase family protein n=1 Tax=Bradyrhizobium sp. U531 TaxID=3053458 RepID=UPI003F426F82